MAESRTQELYRTLRGFPVSVWVLFFGTFLNTFGAFVIPFLTLYLTRHGFSAQDAAKALVSFGLGHVCASITAGQLADRIGRRWTIVLSMFSSAIAMLVLSQLQALVPILIVTFLLGATGQLYRPASSALLADLVPPGRRVIAYSAYRLFLNAGWSCGPATAGFLAKYSYLWLFVGDAITSMLFGGVALLALPKDAPARSAPTAPILPVLREALSRPGFLRLMAASFAIGLVFMQMSSTLGLQLRSRGFSDAEYGLLLSANGLLVVCLELLVSSFSQRYRARRVIALGYLLIGAGFFLNGWAHHFSLFLLAMLIFTLGEMLSVPQASAYLADLAPESSRGRYMGLYGLTWALAVLAGPPAGIYLFGYSPELLWAACGGLGLFAALTLLGGAADSAAAERAAPFCGK